MPAPGWYFGSRGTRDVSGGSPQMGGFNMGQVQKPVDDLSAGVAGGTPGQPGPDAGGMGVGTDAASGSGSTPSTSTPAGNANVTGFSPTLALSGLNFGVGRAAPGLGPLGLGTSVAKAALGFGATNAENSMSNMTDSFGNPVDYTGPQSLFGKAVQSLTGLPMGSLSVTDPDTGISSGVPSVSPNMDGFAGPGAAPSTFNGSTSDGIFGDVTGMGSAGRSGIGPATGVGTGNPSPNSTNFGAQPDVGIAGGKGDPEGTAPSGPTGDSAGVAGVGPASGDGPAGSSGTGEGGGGASGTGGDGGVGTGPGDKRGGRVGPKRPDPRKLSDMLKSGAKVNAGSTKPGADDVPVRLSRGEEVVNKNATDKFGPVLDQMNKLGNRQGGFGVGRR